MFTVKTLTRGKTDGGAPGGPPPLRVLGLGLEAEGDGLGEVGLEPGLGCVPHHKRVIVSKSETIRITDRGTRGHDDLVSRGTGICM